MRYIFVCLVAVAALDRPAVAQQPSIARVPDCVVVLADQADLGPLEAGTIKDIKVAEGQMVGEKDLLVQLEDGKAQAELDVAVAKYHSAETKSQAAKINVEYATSANAVANQDYKVSQAANNNVKGSIPQVTMNEKYLKCEETRLSILKANSDRDVAAEDAKVAAAEVAAARLMVERHKILSPLAGEVVDIRKHKGESVQPTEAAIRIVRLDSLWVQGNVLAANYPRGELDGQDVTVEVVVAGHPTQSLPGKVIFVKPLTDTGGTYMVRAKVENRKVNGSWLLFPGMQGEIMNIQRKAIPAESTLR